MYVKKRYGIRRRYVETTRDSKIDSEQLRRLTSEIAVAEGQLRATHLEAHVKMKSVLSPEQIARYDELRGYSSTGSTPRPAHGGTHSGGKHSGQ